MTTFLDIMVWVVIGLFVCLLLVSIFAGEAAEYVGAILAVFMLTGFAIIGLVTFVNHAAGMF